MKKLPLLLIACFVSHLIFAQSKNTGPELGFGLEGGLPTGVFKQGWNIGVGGTAKFAYNFTGWAAATLQSGIIYFFNTSQQSLNNTPGIKFIPVKAGVRLGSGLYVEPQAGFSFVSSQGNSTTAFTYTINIGYRAAPGVDISVRYETLSKDGDISFFGVRLGYGFML